jgi:hypothetical protein
VRFAKWTASCHNDFWLAIRGRAAPPQVSAIKGHTVLCLKTGKKFKLEEDERIFLVPSSSSRQLRVIKSLDHVDSHHARLFSPDSRSTFNDLWVWRYYVRKLQEEDRLLFHPQRRAVLQDVKATN